MAVTAQSGAVRVQFRPATPDDGNFLLQLFIETQPIEISRWNMDDIAREQLLRMQFWGRMQTYTAQYPKAEDWIICVDEGGIERCVGRHLILRQPDSILGIDLAILPRYQGQGIGGCALQEVQRRCFVEKLRFRLQVLHTNPARRLYSRMGFEVVGKDLLYAQMEWSGVCA